MKLYHKAQTSGQGIIADETTGRTVAVVYESKDGDLLAAAPELLEALEVALVYFKREGLRANGPLMVAEYAISKAKGL